MNLIIIYIKITRVSFKKFLRPEKKFKNFELLDKFKDKINKEFSVF